MRPQAPGFRQLFLIGLCTAFAGIAQAQQIAQPTVIPTGNWPVAVYSADVNGDGKPDLIYVDYGATASASTTHVLVNGGKGNFTPSATLSTAGTSLAVADFDGDGNMDIAWVSATPPQGSVPVPAFSATIAFGHGDGTFSAPSLLGALGLTPFNPPLSTFRFGHLAAGHFYHKTGMLDLVFQELTSNILCTIIGPAPGGGLIGLSGGPGDILLADSNGDGYQDFILQHGTGSVSVSLGGPGPYNVPPITSTFTAASGINSFLVQDIDGDSIPDLVVEGANGALSYFLGTPTGFAATSIPINGAQDGTTGNGGHLVAIADLNGDHIPDIITSTPAGISVLLGQPPLTSHIPYTPTYTLLGIYNAGPGRSSYALADFNGDGHLDLAVDSPEGIAILYGNADGSFQTSRSYAAGQPAHAVALGQFSTGGNVDAVVANGAPVLLQGDGKGGFASSSSPIPAPDHVDLGPNGWWSLAVGDFDGDGNPDAFFLPAAAPQPIPTGNGTGIIIISSNPLPGDLDFGNGAGSFPNFNLIFSNLSITQYASAVGDFNGDGVSDLASFDTSGCAVHLGPSLVFNSSVLASDPAGAAYNTGAVGFLKTGRTNKQDIVCQDSTGMRVFRNNGDGTFTQTAALSPPPGFATADKYGIFPATGLFPANVLLQDLDGDGFGDLIAIYHNLASDPAHPTAATPNQIYIYWGNGDGTFATPTILTTTRNYYQASLAQIDANNTFDLILSDGYLVSVLPNNGLTRTFGAEQHYLAGMGINGIASFPVNGHNVLVTANGGAVFSNPAVNRGTLASNAEVNTGGITVLLPAANPLNTTLTPTLTANPANPGYGRNFTLTATLTPPLNGAIPTGAVTFSLDGAVIATGIQVDATGAATYTVNSPTYAVGTHTLSAVYSGDATYSTLTLTGSITVTYLPSQTYINNIVSPIIYGDIIGNVAQGFAAPLNPSDTALLDGGNLVFFINGQAVCTLPFISGITQTCPPTTGAGYPVGTYTLSSAYTGNQFYLASTSPDYTVMVMPADTQGALTSSLNPAVAGQAVTFTATFTSPFAMPIGTVTFFDGATAIGSATLNTGGIATLTTSTLIVGTHPITATLASSLNFNGSTTIVLQQVITPPVIPPVATTTVLTSSINPSNVGQSVTFTALVTPGAVVSQAIPTGTINFTVDGIFIGTITLNAQGIASITSSTLTAGGHIIAASYSGSPTGSSPTYLSSAATLVQQVNAIVAGSFTLTVTPATLSVPIGNSAIALATITELNGFSQPVTLSCGNLSRGVTCAFTSTTIPAGGGTTQLAVSAMAPHDCSNTAPYFVSSGSSGWPGLLASSGLILLLRRRRKLITAIALTLALCILPTTIGCGNCTDLGVYPGNYSFTVTATSTTPTAITATQTMQMKAHL